MAKVADKTGAGKVAAGEAVVAAAVAVACRSQGHSVVKGLTDESFGTDCHRLAGYL